jgi:hypothetical protein
VRLKSATQKLRRHRRTLMTLQREIMLIATP